MSNEKTIIEINGVKLEVDLRDDKVIENYKVGDNVKVLIKEYSDSYKTCPGVIVGFDKFQKLPTINIMYAEMGYSKAEIKIIAYNANTDKYEICKMSEAESILDKNRAVEYLDDEILRKKLELDELTKKRNYFIEKYEANFK